MDKSQFFLKFPILERIRLILYYLLLIHHFIWVNVHVIFQTNLWLNLFIIRRAWISKTRILGHKFAFRSQICIPSRKTMKIGGNHQRQNILGSINLQWCDLNGKKVANLWRRKSRGFLKVPMFCLAWISENCQWLSSHFLKKAQWVSFIWIFD